MSRLLLLPLFLSLACTTASPASRPELHLASGGSSEPAAAWNRFRGPNGCGIADTLGLPAEIGPGTNVLWKAACPEGHSSPVLGADHVVVTALEDERLFTLAFERETGELAWKSEAPRPRRTEFHPKNHPAAASAAIDGDTVVVFFEEYGMLAYELDGRERWRLPLGPFDNVYGMGASPVIVDDAVVLACDQSTGSYVIAVSKQDGATLWREERPRAVSGHCTPVVREAAGRKEVLLPGSYLLDAYDATSGERLWWVQGLPSEMKSTPVLLDDTLWIHGFGSPLNNKGNQLEFPEFEDALSEVDADGDGQVAATELPDARVRNLFEFLDLDRSGALDAIEWQGMRESFAAVNSAMALRPGGRGDVTDSNVLWQTYRSIPQLPSPLIFGGVYYMLNDQGGLITTLSAGSGETIERGRLAQGVDAYYTSPVAGDGKIYILSEGGLLTVLPEGGSLEPLHAADFGEPCYATPAIEDGRIWVRTASSLYCFAAPAPQPQVVAAMVAVAPGVTDGEGWPQYNGAASNRTSSETIALSKWPSGGPPVAWKAETTRGFSSFAVVGERAYTLVSREGMGQRRETCVALDTETGKELWSAYFDTAKYDGGGDSGGDKGDDGPRSTPSCDGERVYVFDAGLGLHALDAETGELVWAHDLKEEYGGRSIRWQSASCPLVEGDLVLVAGGGQGQSLLAFDKRTGELAWKTGDEKITHATPVAATIHGVRQVIFYLQSGLLSLDPKTGRELWRAAFDYRTSSAASPVVEGNIVYCSAGYGVGAGTFEIVKAGDGLEAKPLWRKRNRLINHWSTPVVKDGHLYGMFSFKEYGNGPLECVELATGDVKWSTEGFGPGNAILVGDLIVALSDAGEVVLVEADPKKYRELARADVLDGKCWSTPVFSGGQLYVRSTREGARLDLSGAAAKR